MVMQAQDVKLDKDELKKYIPLWRALAIVQITKIVFWCLSTCQKDKLRCLNTYCFLKTRYPNPEMVYIMEK